MKLKKTFYFFSAMSLTVAIASSSNAEDWLRFRGSDGSGVSQGDTSTVVEFDDEKSVVWKTEMPGAGASSPIVVGNKIFVTCYSGYGISRNNVGEMDKLKRHVVCINKADGSIIWQKDIDSHLPEDPFSGMGVPEHGYASGTPVSDGKHVYAFFGKTGVIAFDLDGKEVWKKSVGTDSGRMRWGSGASPVLHGDVLIVNATDEAASLVGLNKQTGEEVWKNDGIHNVWGTPVIAGEGDDATLVFSVPYEVWGLNPKDGKLKWFATNGVQDRSVSASPIVHKDIIISMGGRSNTAVAIRRGGKKAQDVTESHTVWSGRATGRIVTPVAVGDYVFGFSQGRATCLKADTGEQVYQERMPSTGSGNSTGGRRGGSSDYCSPVAADGKIYQFTKSGTCFVIAAKPEFKVLAVNKFEKDGTEFNSTPAISDGKLFVRSNKYLYCLGVK